jgi:hypothetical protein
MMMYVEAAKAKGLDKDSAFAKLIAAPERRERWTKLRGENEIRAILTCRHAIRSNLKAPDEVEWKDYHAGYDPDEDWIMNVEQSANAMNSFGAKLRSTFYCRLVCVEDPENGLNCLPIKVKEL